MSSSNDQINHATDAVILQTVQVTPIRHLFNALKDLATDLNAIIDNNELKITNYDKRHTSLIDVHIRFDLHVCRPQKISICANSLRLFKLISKATNNDVMGLYISDHDYNDGSVSKLGIQFNNKNFNQQTNFKMDMFEPEEEELVLPEVDYDGIIVMTSAGFQKIIHDFNGGLVDKIRIESIGDEVVFSAVGQWCDIRISRKEFSASDTKGAAADKATDMIQFKKKPHASNVIRGEFPFKCLMNITRLTQLSPTLEIYLKNDLPLIVKYHIGSDMGFIRICVAPLPPQTTP
jgi:proliferating cell nuclear antigen